MSSQIHLSPSRPMALGQPPSFSSGFQPLPLYLCLPLSFMRHPACCPHAALRPHFPPLFALSSGGTSTKPPPGFLSPVVSGSGSPPQLPPFSSNEDQPHGFPHQPCRHAHLCFWDAFSCFLSLTNTPFYFGKKKKLKNREVVRIIVTTSYISGYLSEYILPFLPLCYSPLSSLLPSLSLPTVSLSAFVSE